MTNGWKIFPFLTQEQLFQIRMDRQRMLEEEAESDSEQQRKTYFEIAGV